jgi:N,N-dimethylformamidase
VVRLRNGDTNPAGPGFREEVVTTQANGRYPAREQEIRTGSAVLVADGGGLALGPAGAVHVFAQPTTPSLGDQTFLARWDVATGSGWWLGLAGGRLTLRLGDGATVHETAADGPVHAWTWYSVVASWDGGATHVSATPVLTRSPGPAAWRPTTTTTTSHE